MRKEVQAVLTGDPKWASRRDGDLGAHGGRALRDEQRKRGARHFLAV